MEIAFLSVDEALQAHVEEEQPEKVKGWEEDVKRKVFRKHVSAKKDAFHLILDSVHIKHHDLFDTVLAN